MKLTAARLQIQFLGNDTIYGNNGADKLFGGEGDDLIDGGVGNDSIYGGEGENTLTGGEGKDVFINDGGNDTITDYTAGSDKIKFTEEITNTTVSGKDVIFETESGKVTVKDVAGTEITYITNKGKTIKQKDFDVSAKTLDLLYDNNFMTDEFALDDITEAKFEVTEIQNSTAEIAQDDKTLITYGEDK